jgi:hypothetical protein
MNTSLNAYLYGVKAAARGFPTELFEFQYAEVV